MSRNKETKREIKNALKNGNYFLAAKLYESEENYKKAIVFYKKGNRHFELGQLYEYLGKKKEAIEEYATSRNFEKLTDMELIKDNFDLAISILIKHNYSKFAAGIYYNIGSYIKAAQLYTQANDCEMATRCYEKVGDHIKAAQLCAQCNDHRKASFYYEKAGDYRMAADSLKQSILQELTSLKGDKKNHRFFRDLDHAADLYLLANDPEKAYDLFIKGKQYGKAASIAKMMGNFDNAAHLFEEAQMPADAADMYEKLGKRELAYKKRAQNAEKSNPIEAADWLLKAKEYNKAAEIYLEKREYEKAAYCFYMNLEYDKAAENYLKAENLHQAAKMKELNKDWQAAAYLYEECKEYREAGELYEKAGCYYQSGLCYYKFGNKKKALSSLQNVKIKDRNFLNAILQISNIYLENNRPHLILEKNKNVLVSQFVNNNNLDLYYINAEAYRSIGDYNNSLELFKRIQNVADNFKDVKKKISEINGLIKKNRILNTQPPYSYFAERYGITDILGLEDIGIAYKAGDMELDRMVKLKVFSNYLLKDISMLKEISSAVQKAIRFSHENIAQLYEGKKVGENYYIVMEFIEGATAFDILNEINMYPLELAIDVAEKIFKALSYAHRNRVVHYSINPKNIFISSENRIKLINVGINSILYSIKNEQIRNSFINPLYMSPEQIKNSEINHLTDIYSTGVTLFQLLTGKTPFNGDNIMHQHLNEPPPTISDYRSDIPKRFAYIIERCMAKEKQDRFKNADEILIELKNISKPLTSRESLFIKRLKNRSDEYDNEKTIKTKEIPLPTQKTESEGNLESVYSPIRNEMEVEDLDKTILSKKIIDDD